MARQRKLKVGDRVEGGKSGTKDYDRGRIVAIDARAHVATVAWDSLVMTPAPLDILHLITGNPSGRYPAGED